MIKYAENIIEEINERGTIKVRDNCVTGEEFEKWLYEIVEKKSMNRENIIITDDNFDEEFEKICDENGYPYGCDVEFVESLPEGFTKSDDNIWVKTIIKPNIAIDCSSAIENYKIAFSFANGFMIFTERSSLYD